MKNIRPNPTTSPLGLVLLGLFGLLGLVSPATAQEAPGQNEPGDVSFLFGAREAWVGGSMPVRIEVINATRHSPPVIPEIDGAEAELLEPPVQTSVMQFIDGYRVMRRSTTYTMLVRPLRPGVIEIPPITVLVDGRELKSQPWRLRASEGEVDDLMFVDIVADPPTAWVGQPVELTLQIWIKQYRDTRKGIALDENRTWSLVDVEASDWGIFTESLQGMLEQQRRPQSRRVDRDGVVYFLYEIETVRHPIAPGKIDAEDVRIIFQQPLDLRIQRDFFGRREYVAEGTRPIPVEAERKMVTVAALPTEGQPPEFTGAVGKFRVEARAEPREVSVGDPITLLYEVTDLGTGIPVDLANLRPPAFERDPALEGFRIPDSPTTGVVEGRTKVFTETLRPERENLDLIPGITFVTFDPDLKRYIRLTSEPIVISVEPSARLELRSTVRRGANDDGSEGRGTVLTATTGTLRPDRPAERALLGSTPVSFGWPIGVAVAAAPTAFLLSTIRRRRRAHREANPHLVRASSARTVAAARLAASGNPAEAVHEALCGLVASRLHRPEGALTTREAVDLARSAGLPEADVEELRSVLTAAESARYGGGNGEDRALVEQAETLLPRLDRIRPGARP